MAATALSRLPTQQTVDSDFDDDLLAYALADHHEEDDKHDTKEKIFLTIKQFIAGQQDDARCRHLAKKADDLDSLFIYDAFGIL